MLHVGFAGVEAAPASSGLSIESEPLGPASAVSLALPLAVADGDSADLLFPSSSVMTVAGTEGPGASAAPVVGCCCSCCGAATAASDVSVTGFGSTAVALVVACADMVSQGSQKCLPAPLGGGRVVVERGPARSLLSPALLYRRQQQREVVWLPWGIQRKLMHGNRGRETGKRRGPADSAWSGSLADVGLKISDDPPRPLEVFRSLCLFWATPPFPAFLTGRARLKEGDGFGRRIGRWCTGNMQNAGGF